MLKILVWYLVPRLQDLLFSLLFVSVLLLGSKMLNIDSDLGVHLTTGEYILTSHSIPKFDLYSFTKPGDVRPPYAWLAEVSFAIAFRLGDMDGVIGLCALVIALGFTVIYHDALKRSGYPLLALTLTLLAAVTSSIHWLPRPHLFSFLLFAVWLACLDSTDQTKNFPIWIYPMIMLAWANMHAGFIFGVVAWAAYLAGSLYEGLFLKNYYSKLGVKHFFLIGSFSIVATFLTPGGLDSWQAVLGNSNVYLASHTIETQPPSYSQPSTWIVLSTLIAGIYLIIKKEIPPAQALLFTSFGVLSLAIARLIPLFMIAAAPILAVIIGRRLAAIKFWSSIESRVTTLQSRLRGVIWPSMVVLGSILFLGINRSITGQSVYTFDPEFFPIQAVNWLEKKPQPGNMFNNIDWSGYILHRLWPAQKVFMDSRTDFYGEAMLRDYEAILTASPRWADLLDHYNVKWVLIRADAPLVHALYEAGWQQLYRDSLAVILYQSVLP